MLEKGQSILALSKERRHQILPLQSSNISASNTPVEDKTNETNSTCSYSTCMCCSRLFKTCLILCTETQIGPRVTHRHLQVLDCTQNLRDTESVPQPQNHMYVFWGSIHLVKVVCFLLGSSWLHSFQAEKHKICGQAMSCEMHCIAEI